MYGFFNYCNEQTTTKKISLWIFCFNFIIILNFNTVKVKSRFISILVENIWKLIEEISIYKCCHIEKKMIRTIDCWVKRDIYKIKFMIWRKIYFKYVIKFKSQISKYFGWKNSLFNSVNITLSTFLLSWGKKKIHSSVKIYSILKKKKKISNIPIFFIIAESNLKT